MERIINRRQLLKTSLAATSALGAVHLSSHTSRAVDYAKPAPEAKGLTAYLNHSNLLLRWNNLPVLGYRAHPTLKYPYFCPLNGPVSGQSLTTESALPYPHHRGLWLGCDPLNGGNYWSDGPLSEGQIRSVDLQLVEPSKTEEKPATQATFTESCEWVREGASSPFRDARQYTVRIVSDRVRCIDCEFVLSALEEISIRKAKHSFFAMRAAADISPTYGGTMMNSEGGVGAEGTYGKEAAWCGYFGRRALQPNVVEGIAIMHHPDNPWRPIWFTRDYGHLSPSPFNFLDKPFQLAKGDTLQLKYRVVLHAGDPQEAGMNGLYQQWLRDV